MAQPIQYSFQRYEKKYFLTPGQYAALRKMAQPYIREDDYGKTAICNIYYDTDDFQLIRASIEKPVYKEKLRIRSYGVPEESGKVFIELKKKYDGIVCKRRILSTADRAPILLNSRVPSESAGQIEKEIFAFLQRYRTAPKVFIGYDRVACVGREDPSLRITFDTRLRWRETNPDLRAGDSGAPILSEDLILMELKVPLSVPLWLCRILSGIGAVPTSFSKYGACYINHLLPRFQKRFLPKNENENKNYNKKEDIYSA